MHTLTLALDKWDVLPGDPLGPSQVNQCLGTMQDSSLLVTYSGSKKKTAETVLGLSRWCERTGCPTCPLRLRKNPESSLMV